MPCEDAMITKVITVTPDTKVSEAVARFLERGIRSVPVVDEANELQGIFSFPHLLRDLLPATMDFHTEHQRLQHFDIKLDQFHGMSPFIAKKLATTYDKNVSELMNEDPPIVHPDTTLREGLRLLVKAGSPLAVVSKGTKNLVGIITSQSTTAALQDILAKIERGEDVQE